MRRNPKQAAKGRSREENAIKKRKKLRFCTCRAGIPLSEQKGLPGEGEASVYRQEFRKFLFRFWLRGESLFF